MQNFLQLIPLLTPIVLIFALALKVNRIEDKLDEMIDLMKIHLEFLASITSDTELIRALRNRTSAINRSHNFPTRS